MDFLEDRGGVAHCPHCQGPGRAEFRCTPVLVSKITPHTQEVKPKRRGSGWGGRTASWELGTGSRLDMGAGVLGSVAGELISHSGHVAGEVTILDP